MGYIKAMIYLGAKAGKYADDISKESLRVMKERTGCNTVILNIGALQDTAQSESVDFTHAYIQKDNELVDMIQFAQELDLDVILKPVVNCKDGTWRAYISFFEVDVVCEPKWCNWFESYTRFLLHYAKIAEETGCTMFIIGSDMVQTEKKETMWRNLIADVRKVYTGMLTYTADKYMEENVKWWDGVDVISSCGYFPKDEFEHQMDRIEKLAKKYNKPYFLSEIGCKSTVGSSTMPNSWALQGALCLNEQAAYFEKVLRICRSRKFIEGVGIWNWYYQLPDKKLAREDKGYRIYQKPACDIIYDGWKED